MVPNLLGNVLFYCQCLQYVRCIFNLSCPPPHPPSCNFFFSSLNCINLIDLVPIFFFFYYFFFFFHQESKAHVICYYISERLHIITEIKHASLVLRRKLTNFTFNGYDMFREHFHLFFILSFFFSEGKRKDYFVVLSVA